jgi:hypothetical protein
MKVLTVVAVVLMLGLAACVLSRSVDAQAVIMNGDGAADLPRINVQVWAKGYAPVDCGKYFSRAAAEREKRTPNWNASMTDTSLFWACMEINRQVNAQEGKQ